MKLTKKSGVKIAMTAAALIISGTTLIAAANAETFKGRCFGVNGCKGPATASPPRTTARARMTAKATAGSRCCRPNAPTPAASGSRSNPLSIATGSRPPPAPE